MQRIYTYIHCLNGQSSRILNSYTFQNGQEEKEHLCCRKKSGQVFFFYSHIFFPQVFKRMTLPLLSVVLSESGNPGRLARSSEKMAPLFLKVAPFISWGLPTTAVWEKGMLFYRVSLKGKEKYMVFTVKKTGPFSFISVATSEMEVAKAINTHKQLRLKG